LAYYYFSTFKNTSFQNTDKYLRLVGPDGCSNALIREKYDFTLIEHSEIQFQFPGPLANEKNE
jgi:hypothetical protein